MGVLISVLSALVVFIAFYVTAQLENKIVSNVVRVLAAIASFIAVAYIPSLVGVPVEEMSSITTNWFYILIVGAILSLLFRRGEKSEKDDQPE